MITAYLWGTPNGYKIAIALEEMGLDYQIKWVNIGAGEQHTPEFRAVSPNGKIPALTDDETGVTIMESGAILQYLAEKTGKFGGNTLQERMNVTQWLHWQMGGLGPMMGQANHFRGLKDPVPYGLKRYTDESVRLFEVLDKQLEGRDYITGEYSIADIAIGPWIAGLEYYGVKDAVGWSELKNVPAYLDRFLARPAVQRGRNIPPREI